MINNPKLRYEEAAELRTNLEGWVCRTCGQNWSKDEHTARLCCAKDIECAGEGCAAREPESSPVTIRRYAFR